LIIYPGPKTPFLGLKISRLHLIPCTVGSPFLSEFFSVPYRTVPYRTVPQQAVYRFKYYRTIQTDFVLKTQFSVYRSVPEMHFFPFFLNTKKLYERNIN
jgi:hypothetical protein